MSKKMNTIKQIAVVETLCSLLVFIVRVISVSIPDRPLLLAICYYQICKEFRLSSILTSNYPYSW